MKGKKDTMRHRRAVSGFIVCAALVMSPSASVSGPDVQPSVARPSAAQQSPPLPAEARSSVVPPDIDTDNGTDAPPPAAVTGEEATPSTTVTAPPGVPRTAAEQVAVAAPIAQPTAPTDMAAGASAGLDVAAADAAIDFICGTGLVEDVTPPPVTPPTPDSGPRAGPDLPYSPDAFFRSTAEGAPIDQSLTAQFHSFMVTHPDQRGVGYPVIRGVGGNRWGTPFATGRPGDVRWTLTGSVPGEVADLRTEGFYAPADFGASITGTSDSPFVVHDEVRGQTVWGAKAVVMPGHVLEVSAAGRFMHSSNGLDRRNPRSDDERNFRSRGAIPDAMVIRRDLMDDAVARSADLGHVLHFFIVESDTAAGVVHPMTGAETDKFGFGAEGTRIVLRPDFPVDALASPEARVLARTLIRYGMYIGDNAGSGSSLKAQQDVGGQVWGSRLTVDTLDGLDWQDFRVVTPGWQ